MNLLLRCIIALTLTFSFIACDSNSNLTQQEEILTSEITDGNSKDVNSVQTSYALDYSISTNTTQTVDPGEYAYDLNFSGVDNDSEILYNIIAFDSYGIEAAGFSTKSNLMNTTSTYTFILDFEPQATNSIGIEIVDIGGTVYTQNAVDDIFDNSLDPQGLSIFTFIIKPRACGAIHYDGETPMNCVPVVGTYSNCSGCSYTVRVDRSMDL